MTAIPPARPPRVSVVMPVYNAGRFLDEAIASTLADDFDDFELVAVDDGSTDDSAARLARWAERDPRVIVHRQPNRGIAEALNAGLQIARGELIARMDADDVLLNRFRRQVAELDRSPAVALVSTWFEIIDAAGTTVGVHTPPESSKLLAWLLNFYNVLGGHSQVMFRRSTALSIGGYRREYAIAEDYDLWTRLAEHGRIVMLPFIGVRRRHHAAAASTVERTRQSASSTAIMRRTLSTHLGRPVTGDEAAGVATLWRGGFDLRSRTAAVRVTREAYAGFEIAHQDGVLRRRARSLIARRWMILGLRCLGRFHWIDAARCFAEAIRWDARSGASLPLIAARVAFRRAFPRTATKAATAPQHAADRDAGSAG